MIASVVSRGICQIIISFIIVLICLNSNSFLEPLYLLGHLSQDVRVSRIELASFPGPHSLMKENVEI